MRLLVTGAKGQLGWELMRRAGSLGLRATGVDLPEVDLCDNAQMRQTLRAARPQVVINAAAYTDVDGAESDRENCYRVNAEVPGELAVRCREAGIPLVHLSTDFVFHAPRDTPWEEAAPVSPTGVYAKSKAAGETAVRRALSEHILVRTAWLYGIRGRNFVKTMLTLATEREEIGVVNDQVGSPTFAGDLAEALLKLAAKLESDAPPAWGTYHFCGGGSTTWYGLAKAAIDQARERGLAPRLERLRALTTAEYPTAAVRPAYSVLACGRIEKALGVTIAPWEASLEAAMDDLYAEWRAGR